MQSIRHTLFFINQYYKQLVKKKWATLLLVLFPVTMIGLLLILVAGLILPTDNEPIRVVLVDEDDTMESSLLATVIEETLSGNEFIDIDRKLSEEASSLIVQDKISAYFSFPEGFTEDLYEGNSVTIPIIGNPSRITESFVVKELVESMSRLLAGAQASMLTINSYAKELEMPEEERQELLVEQLMDFTFYTLGKNKLLDQEVITNIATSSPKHYYILAGWFTLLSVWLLAFYMMIGKEEDDGMLLRMKLFGVTMWQRVWARIQVALGAALFLATLAFVVIEAFVDFELLLLDYARFALYTFLYALLLLIGIALIDVWISSRKIALLGQSFLTFFMIFTSGAIIPTLYFPQTVQAILPYLFSYESMNWMIDIVLEARNYADYTFMFVATLIGLVILSLSTIVKERWT